MNQPMYPVGPTQGQPAQRNLGQLIANLGPQSPIAQQSTLDPRALAAGIKPSFATINFKGKTWGIRYRGTTQQLLARGPQGEILGSIPTIDIIVVKSATAISKSFYIDKYREGNFAAPDCWSTNGLVPDLGAAKKQSETCKGCRWDAFGSRTMDDGRKGKACSDNKRVAVVPATDIKNEAFGGPMLLKLPPSGFNGLSELEAQLHMQGYVYWGVVMRLSFDHEAPFPKIIFTPVRVLNDYEQQEIVNMQLNNETVERILSEELIEVSADPNQPTNEVATPAAPVTSGVTPPAPTSPQPSQSFMPPPQAFDPGPMPAHLVRQQPNTGMAAATGFGQPAPTPPPMTAEQQRIRDLEAQLAAARQPAAPPQLTPEQQRIADLEAQLAAAKTGAAPAVTVAKPARQVKKRTQPVTPAATEAAGPPLPFQGADPHPAQATQAAGPAGNGAAAVDTNGADAPADLDSRIDKLLGNPGTPST